MISNWSTAQWIAFTGLSASGLGALGLLGLAVHVVRGWTSAATYRLPAATLPVPRPTLALATRRAMSNTELADFEQRFRESRERIATVWSDTIAAPALHIDPTGEIAAHLAPGPGALTSLAEVGEGSLKRLTHDDLVDPEVAQWFAEAFDRPPHVPGPTEAGVLDEGGVMARFHAAIEPALRTAHLWEIRGRGRHGVLGAARKALDDWRINCPTGEWPIIVPAPAT